MKSEAQLLANLFPYPRLVLTRGKGCWVWDNAGQRYLDFTAGLGVLALGHGNTELAAVLSEQFATLAHCSNLFATEASLALAERLIEASFAARVWFANSGAEANEAALKFARLHGRSVGGPEKLEFIAFKRGFHGRTFGSLAVTHEPKYRDAFEPVFPGHVHFAEFNQADSVARLMNERVCGVIVEPVQGEGGVLPAEAQFLRDLRALCDAKQALLIFDEVQCGMARTGHLFAYQESGVAPDIMTLAKPLAGGLPLGATLVNERVNAVLAPGLHGSTFAGGPATCAVGVKVFDTVSQPAFLRRVQEAGGRLRAGLAAVAEASSMFSGVRGKGLMLGLVVADPALTAPLEIVQRARSLGLLVSRAGADTIRFLPPLVCEDEDIDHAVEVMRRIAG